MPEEQIIANTARLIIDRSADGAIEREQILRVGPGATLTYCLVHTAGNLKRNVIVTLEQGASALVIGAFLGRGQDRIDIRVDTIHEGPGATGRTKLRGVLAESARAECTGLISIPPTGVRASAFFEERVLLLSPTAVSESLPSLEIEANDVKAGHAATTGGLDDELLFYAMSRGLPRDSAARMLLVGFLGAALADLPDGERQTLLPGLERAIQDLSLPTPLVHG